MNAPDSSATPPATARFHHIDALRGIAVLLVVMVHVGHYTAADLWFTRISEFGQYGVQLFFMLSAFTLCHSLSRQEKLEPGGYTSFLTRRFFRIAPMYYAAAIFYTLYTIASFRLFGKTPWTEPADLTAGGFISNATFTHALWPTWINSVVPGGWSIACEFLFYLVFPFIFFASRRRAIVLLPLFLAGVMATLLLPAIYRHLGWGGTPENNSFHYYFPTNQLPAFITGMLLHRWWSARGLHLSLLAISPLMLWLLVWAHRQPWGWMATPAVSAIFFAGLTSLLARVRTPRWLERTGECSFSVYLVHFFIVWNVCVLALRKFPAAVEHEAPAILLYVGISAISIIISRQTYRFIELPMIGLGRRVSLRLSRPSPRDHVAPAN